MCEIVHIPLRFMAGGRKPFDPREQAVAPADSVARSLAYRDVERQRALDAMPDDAARERLRDRFDDADERDAWKEVVRLADIVSREMFTCPSACLPTHKREQLLVAIEGMLTTLNTSPYK
jgi:hypothetical protein